ncbi:MAG: CinA family protein [Hyphomicrobiaceae bacterium]|nr:CinA family protein [Hyphomicrobiaceae bacterium]
MFLGSDVELASAFIGRLRAAKLTFASAESCTGGLIGALLTDIPGSSDVFERGFITYSNGAKCDLLGVPATLLGRYGAVSAEVADAMVTGALRASTADVAVAVTGIAGPGGGTNSKPIGLVYVSAASRGRRPVTAEHRYGDIGRSEVRLATVRSALALADHVLDSAGVG